MKRFSHKAGTDFWEIFDPVIKYNNLRMVLAFFTTSAHDDTSGREAGFYERKAIGRTIYRTERRLCQQRTGRKSHAVTQGVIWFATSCARRE